jgi:hypothetical protein
MSHTLESTFASQLLSMIEYYKNEDCNIYEKLIYCLYRYQEEEENIFGFSDHEDGGYGKPPSYFVEFGQFMDNIRQIYKFINLTSHKNIRHKYRIENFGRKHFNWNNYESILDDIIPIY